jgi:hypothetical protein
MSRSREAKGRSQFRPTPTSPASWWRPRRTSRSWRPHTGQLRTRNGVGGLGFDLTPLIGSFRGFHAICGPRAPAREVTSTSVRELRLRRYPRALPDPRSDRFTTQDCSVTSPDGVIRFFIITCLPLFPFYWPTDPAILVSFLHYPADRGTSAPGSTTPDDGTATPGRFGARDAS